MYKNKIFEFDFYVNLSYIANSFRKEITDTQKISPVKIKDAITVTLFNNMRRKTKINSPLLTKYGKK